jgi:hypothetical protein
MKAIQSKRGKEQVSIFACCHVILHGQDVAASATGGRAGILFTGKREKGQGKTKVDR